MSAGDIIVRIERDASGKLVAHARDRGNWTWTGDVVSETVQERAGWSCTLQLGPTPAHDMLPDETPDRRRV